MIINESIFLHLRCNTIVIQITMKKHFISFVAMFFTFSLPTWSDIDITELYLQNAGFDDSEHFNYRINESGNVAQEILPVYGWNKDISVDYTITGVYEYGTQKTFNTSGTVPSAGYQGSKGGCLALSTGWDQSMKFYQKILLPEGSYKIQAPFFNGSNSTNGYSLLGWIPDQGNAVLSTLSSIPMNWTMDEVSFTLSAAQEGKIQIGFKGVSNGSANSAKVVVDYVKIIMVGDNNSLVSKLSDQLTLHVNEAKKLLDGPLYEVHRSALQTAIAQAEMWISQPNTSDYSAISSLSKAYASAQSSSLAYQRLSQTISQAEDIYQPNLKESESLKKTIEASQYVERQETFSVDDVNYYIHQLEEAIFVFQVANASGSAPSVITDPRHATGATMAFGRATFAGSDIVEKGFCWSSQSNPSVLDNRSTLSYSNNGDIYVIQGLEPATIYYMRPYAISRSNTVGYGEKIKICTLPQGEVTWSYNNGGSDDENRRINGAVKDACDIWNQITSIRGLHLTVNYGANTQTADCSYGGWMRVGPNASYQRTGTIQHEMCHAAGVGTTDTWYNSSIYRQETNKGFWLGERTDQILHFLENNNSAQLKGDNTHFWPYGINGAHEDDGSRMLYYANAMIIQALGEDNLPPLAGAFASPAYTFTQEDYETYYILSAHDALSMPTMLRQINGEISLQSCDWTTALKENGYGWKIRFNPESQFYELKNIESGKALTCDSKLNSTSMDNYQVQMLGSRQNVSNSFFNLKSYWLCFNNGTNRPMALTANNYTATVSYFDHQNNATQQRWIILSKAEVKALAGDMTGVAEAENNRDLLVYNDHIGLAFETFQKGAWVSVYDLQGLLVDKFYMQANLRITKTYPKGVYVVNGKKVVVRIKN